MQSCHSRTARSINASRLRSSGLLSAHGQLWAALRAALFSNRKTLRSNSQGQVSRLHLLKVARGASGDVILSEDELLCHAASQGNRHLVLQVAPAAPSMQTASGTCPMLSPILRWPKTQDMHTLMQPQSGPVHEHHTRQVPCTSSIKASATRFSGGSRDNSKQALGKACT